MKILITGSNGFLGKEVKSLLKTSNKITDYNKSDGKDILDKSELESQMKGIDAVIHLAGITDNTNNSLWDINVKGTKNVIEAAIKSNIKKLIFISSTGVYGRPKGQINENSETLPETNYEKSKLEAEKIILAHKEKIHTNIIRSAMIFGKNTYWEGMFKLLKKDAPLPINGNNTFQVIYVKELARVIQTVLKNGKSGETYLASGKEKFTLNEFCSLCKKEMNLNNTKIKHIPTIIAIIFGKLTNSKTLTTDNIRHLGKERNYELKKLSSLGYKQKIPLKEVISEIIKKEQKAN